MKAITSPYATVTSGFFGIHGSGVFELLLESITSKQAKETRRRQKKTEVTEQSRRS